MIKHEHENHLIYQGDALEILENEIRDSSIDLIFVDPPYNIGKDFNGLKDKWATDELYLDWCYKWITLCLKKLKPTGSFYVMTSTQFIPYFDIFLRNKIEILSRIIWSYDSSGVQAKKFYGSMYEPILFCVKDKNNYTFNADDILVEAKTGAKRNLIDYRKNPPQPYNTEKVPGNVWDFPRVRYRMNEYENHPTQKPIALLERIIKASSNEGDTILDPFSGSFTTSYVAKKLKRKSIGIEINEDFTKIGLRRVQELSEINGDKLYREPKTYETKNFQQHLYSKKSSMVLIHNPGECLYVDFAGKKMSFVDAQTGEVIDCEVFVACLPYSDYGFVMETEQRSKIWGLYRHMELPKIEILNIPDNYEFMNNELIEILTERINDTFKINYQILFNEKT